MNETTRRKIEKRAYELFIERRGSHGYHMEDWLRAEREIAVSPKKAAAEPVIKTKSAAAKKTAAPAKGKKR